MESRATRRSRAGGRGDFGEPVEPGVQVPHHAGVVVLRVEGEHYYRRADLRMRWYPRRCRSCPKGGQA
ncbi:hypothetical protein J7I98_08365 [Streptomyces sp. ISL-98]|uniref:hypothetical protein n=1 Tax=Streptomyces sp. ISL-98 TaxID=2819192 RepID=UPI001BE5F3DE|nr:hypothetical protein [Streptomyces sp. ISL-98]MBT2505910.1 hypothetical protein [Streptomyces sp. ISL-98]